MASRKLRPYFHTHTIEILTNYPLRQVLKKPEAYGRLLKWAIELGQLDINYRPRATIKGQALVKYTYSNTTEVVGTTNNVGTTKGVGIENGETFATKREYGDLGAEQ